MVFAHSGNSGDIVYSIPTINHLTNGERKAIIYIKKANYITGNQYDFVKDLLLQQPCIKEVHPFTPVDNNWSWYNWPGLKYDYDLDLARMQSQRGRIHIVKRYFDAFNIKEDHTKTWLSVDNVKQINGNYALIHLTPRWNGYQYDWKRIYNEALKRHDKIYFIGFVSEWLDFTIRYDQIEHLPTDNLLDIARLINNCDALYCNQGVALTIAQGLGKEFWLVRNGYKTNCHISTSNEHLIGSDYLLSGLHRNDLPDTHKMIKQ